MKYFYLFAPLFLFWLACNEPVEEPLSKVVITGSATEELEINLHGETKIADTEIDSTGIFAFEFEADGPAYYYIRGGRQRIDLYLAPGDSIHIAFEGDNWAENTRFSADRTPENKYLLDKENLLEAHDWNNFRKIFNLEKDSFLQVIDNGETALEGLLSELEDNPEVDENFIAMERAHPSHQVAILNYYYPMYYAHFQQVEGDEVDHPIEDNRVLEEALNRPELLPLPSFREALEIQMEILFQDHLPEDIYEEELGVVLREQYKIIDTLLENEKIREFLKFSFLNDQLSYSGPGAVDSLYEDYIHSSSNASYVNTLKETMNEWSEIMPGMEVPDFEFENIDEEKVNLSDLNGKLVYIDVWATWCGPCLAEHPYWEELVEEYQDKEVHFLAISIDAKREPWEKMVEEKELSGIQWFAGVGWEAEFATHMRVRGIPRFILLDREGKILDVSAARPSGTIRKTLDKNLEASAEI